MVIALAQAADKPGLLDSASPLMMVGGGLGLLVVGVIMLVIALRTHEGCYRGSLPSYVGWVLLLYGGVIIVAIGIVGVCSGLGLFDG